MTTSTWLHLEDRLFSLKTVAGCVACAVAGWAPLALSAESSLATDTALEEVTVTGTRIRQDGITAPTPVTVVDAARMQDLAATNIGNVLNSLPSFRPSANLQTSNIQPRAAGMIQADLRGLAPVRTLVLVNDRRFVPSTQEGTIDLNQVPTLLVERMEVVTGGASAQYGSDAVAGVVNIFTQTRMEGITGELQYGITEQGDGENLRAGMAGGRHSPAGAATSSARSRYEDNRGIGNCYTRDWCAEEWQVITNTGSSNPNAPGHKLIGYPATTSCQSAHRQRRAGRLDTQRPLRGTAFNDNGTPRPFQYGLVFPNNPTFMQGGDGEGRNGFIGAPLMMIPTERYVGFGSLQYEFTDSLQGFAELSYGHTASQWPWRPDARLLRVRWQRDHDPRRQPLPPRGVRTALQNAGLPLTSATSFVLGRMGDDFGYTDNRNESDVMRVLAGLGGSFGDELDLGCVRPVRQDAATTRWWPTIASSSR